ncbi:MAG TPA: Ig-like domain-containing protein [Longimicrobiales bacterium]|nr:Ig-like domain-containing protein [Longimicrobiales bacterium]
MSAALFAARRFLRRAAAPGLAALLAASCGDGLFVDPAPAGGATRVAIAFATGAAQGNSTDAFARADHLHLRIVRSDGSALADTTPALGAGTTELALDIPLRIDSETEAVAITVDVLWTGQALFRGQGTVTLERGRTSPAEIALSPVVTAVRVPSASQTLTSLGDTLRLAGAALFATGDTVTGGVLQWRTLDPTVVEVSSAGLVRALAEGTARVVASSGSIEATTQVVVKAAVARVDVAPTSLTLFVDSVGQLSATARDANGYVLVRTASWTASDPKVASVDAQGRVTGRAPGATSIIATVEGKTSPPVRVVVQAPPVASITLSPAEPSIAAGGSVQLVATPRDAAGNPLSGRPVTWSSDDTAVATVDAAGLVTGRAAGRATITASCEGQSASVVVSVSAPAIQISAASVTFTGYVDIDPNPNYVDLAVTNGGAGELTGLVVDPVVYDSTATGWVGAALSGSTTPATLRIVVSTAQFYPGTYTAYVTVRSTVSGVAPRTVKVQANVYDYIPSYSAGAATAGARPTAAVRVEAPAPRSVKP